MALLFQSWNTFLRKDSRPLQLFDLFLMLFTYNRKWLFSIYIHRAGETPSGQNIFCYFFFPLYLYTKNMIMVELFINCFSSDLYLMDWLSKIVFHIMKILPFLPINWNLSQMRNSSSFIVHNRKESDYNWDCSPGLEPALFTATSWQSEVRDYREQRS